MSLTNVKRVSTKSLETFRTRFDAPVPKFKSHGNESHFFEPLTALQVVNTASVANMQRVSILAACVSKISVLGSPDSMTKNVAITQNIPYSAIFDVFRQRDLSHAD